MNKKIFVSLMLMVLLLSIALVQATEIGNITIEKKTQPVGGTSFNFEVYDSSANIIRTILDDGASLSFVAAASVYRVIEVETIGWKLNDIACWGYGPLDVTFLVNENDEFYGAEINLVEGEDVHCLFTNIEVVNNAPDCSHAYPSIDMLWPPNHRMIPIEIFGVTDADGDMPIINILDIWQDEPVNGDFDGDTAPDAIDNTLRAERNGEGNGRVYHVSFGADDANGGDRKSVV